MEQKIEHLTFDMLPFEVKLNTFSYFKGHYKTRNAMRAVNKEWYQLISSSPLTNMVFKYFILDVKTTFQILQSKSITEQTEEILKNPLLDKTEKSLKITQLKLIGFIEIFFDRHVCALKPSEKLKEHLDIFKKEFISHLSSTDYLKKSASCIEEDKVRWIHIIRTQLAEYKITSEEFLNEFKTHFNWDELFSYFKFNKALLEELKLIKFRYDASYDALSTKNTNIYAPNFTQSLVNIFPKIFKDHGLEDYYEHFPPPNPEELHNWSENVVRLNNSVNFVTKNYSKSVNATRDFYIVEKITERCKKIEGLFNLILNLHQLNHFKNDIAMYYAFFNSLYVINSINLVKEKMALPMEYYFSVAKGYLVPKKHEMEYYRFCLRGTKDLRYMSHGVTDRNNLTIFQYAVKFNNKAFLEECSYDHYNAALASQNHNYFGKLVWSTTKVSRLQWVILTQLSPSELKDKYITEDMLKHKDLWGQTPLHYAARNQDTHWLRRLIKLHKYYNLPLDTVDNNNNAPQHIAAMTGNMRGLKIILDEKVDLKFQNNHGDTVFTLMMAALAEDWRQHRRNTILHIVAAYYTVTDLEQLNSEYDFMASLPNPQGQTPLHLAITTGNLSNIRNLILRKASLHIWDNLGLSLNNYVYMFKDKYSEAELTTLETFGLSPIRPSLSPELVDDDYFLAKYLIKKGFINFTLENYIQSKQDPLLNQQNVDLHFIRGIYNTFIKNSPEATGAQFFQFCASLHAELEHCPLLKSLTKLYNSKIVNHKNRDQEARWQSVETPLQEAVNFVVYKMGIVNTQNTLFGKNFKKEDKQKVIHDILQFILFDKKIEDTNACIEFLEEHSSLKPILPFLITANPSEITLEV